MSNLEELKQEAIRRMKELKIINNVINEFKKDGVIEYSERTPMGGILYWLSNEPEWEAKVKEWEKENDCIVYHATHEHTSFGEMLSLLFVGSETEEWEYDLEKVDDNNYYAFAYVMNLDHPDFSEYGTIGIQPAAGGIIRVS